MENLHMLEFFAEAFQCHVHHFRCLAVPVELAAIKFVAASSSGTINIENGAHDAEKLLLKTQVSEVNLITLYIRPRGKEREYS